MFAYDLNEPDLITILLELAEQGRVRIILDNASLHHRRRRRSPRTSSRALFRERARRARAEIQRGQFGRYAHDKVMIVSDAHGAKKVLTGSTNFSVTGLYVNSNHVLVFDDTQVAVEVRRISSRPSGTETSARRRTCSRRFASERVSPRRAGDGDHVRAARGGFRDPGARRRRRTHRPRREEAARNRQRALRRHADRPGRRVRSTRRSMRSTPTTASSATASRTARTASRCTRPAGEPACSSRASPCVPGYRRRSTRCRRRRDGHQIHHKFVVCGFNGLDPVVYCGSSNLALGGEQANGDNLLEIHDADVVDRLRDRGDRARRPLPVPRPLVAGTKAEDEVAACVQQAGGGLRGLVPLHERPMGRPVLRPERPALRRPTALRLTVRIRPLTGRRRCRPARCRSASAHRRRSQRGRSSRCSRSTG